MNRITSISEKCGLHGADATYETNSTRSINPIWQIAPVFVQVGSCKKRFKAVVLESSRFRGACNTRVRSNEMTGALWDSSFSAVQRRDLHVKSFGEFHDLLGDAEADRIQIQ